MTFEAHFCIFEPFPLPFRPGGCYTVSVTRKQETAAARPGVSKEHKEEQAMSQFTTPVNTRKTASPKGTKALVLAVIVILAALIIFFRCTVQIGTGYTADRRPYRSLGGIPLPVCICICLWCSTAAQTGFLSRHKTSVY